MVVTEMTALVRQPREELNGGDDQADVPDRVERSGADHKSYCGLQRRTTRRKVRSVATGATWWWPLGSETARSEAIGGMWFSQPSAGRRVGVAIAGIPCIFVDLLKVSALVLRRRPGSAVRQHSHEERRGEALPGIGDLLLPTAPLTRRNHLDGPSPGGRSAEGPAA